MASILETGEFPEHLVSELFNAVKGKSSIAALSGATPISFNGIKEFTFQMDKEVDIVAESGAKSNGGLTLEPVTIVPIKFEYGARVTDEFMYASEEEQIAILEAFNEGFSRKLAKGFDIAAMHGVNPRTGLASTVVGPNYFDGKVQNLGEESTADLSVEALIAAIQANDNDVTGIIMAPSLRTALAQLMNGDTKMYPELSWGAAPSVINGLPTQVNSTVSANDCGDLAIAGDFANAFKWGYAKDVMVKVIEYGNPDNDTEAGDLQGHNQVYIRAEAYLGWGILDPASFAVLNSNANTLPTSVKTTSAKASK